MLLISFGFLNQTSQAQQPQEPQEEPQEVSNYEDSMAGIGITITLIGTMRRQVIDGEDYITSMSGLNWTIGYTKRNYFGDGLVVGEGSGYFEYGTLVLIAPYVGAGYSYRFNKDVIGTIGFPAGLEVSFRF